MDNTFKSKIDELLKEIQADEKSKEVIRQKCYATEKSSAPNVRRRSVKKKRRAQILYAMFGICLLGSSLFAMSGHLNGFSSFISSNLLNELDKEVQNVGTTVTQNGITMCVEECIIQPRQALFVVSLTREDSLPWGEEYLRPIQIFNQEPHQKTLSFTDIEQWLWISCDISRCYPFMLCKKDGTDMMVLTPINAKVSSDGRTLSFLLQAMDTVLNNYNESFIKLDEIVDVNVEEDTQRYKLEVEGECTSLNGQEINIDRENLFEGFEHTEGFASVSYKSPLQVELYKRGKETSKIVASDGKTVEGCFGISKQTDREIEMFQVFLEGDSEQKNQGERRAESYATKLVNEKNGNVYIPMQCGAYLNGVGTTSFVQIEKEEVPELYIHQIINVAETHMTTKGLQVPIKMKCETDRSRNLLKQKIILSGNSNITIEGVYDSLFNIIITGSGSGNGSLMRDKIVIKYTDGTSLNWNQMEGNMMKGNMMISEGDKSFIMATDTQSLYSVGEIKKLESITIDGYEIKVDEK